MKRKAIIKNPQAEAERVVQIFLLVMFVVFILKSILYKQTYDVFKTEKITVENTNCHALHE